MHDHRGVATRTCLRPGELLRIRAERWRVDRHAAFGASTIVDVTGVDHANRGRAARFVLPFEPIERMPGTPAPRVVRPPAWRRAVRAILADATPSPLSLRAAARANLTLLPFQLEPALAVTHGLGSRLLIADAVGLGKTIQAGLIASELLERTRDGHVLIVCPAGLREQWQQELASRFSLRSSRIDAATLASGEALGTAGGNPWASHEVAIVSVDYLKRPEVMRGLEEMVWDLIVFDEAHGLAGHSDRAAAAGTVAARGRIVVMLTATPHSGNDRQFAALADIGRLPGDGPLLVFRRTRADAGLASTRRVHWLPIAPTAAERLMHAALDQYVRAVWRAQATTTDGARLAMILLLRRASSSAHALARSIQRRLSLLAGDDVDVARQLTLPLARIAAGDEEPAAELATPGLADAAEERRHLERLVALSRRAALTESKVTRLRRFLQQAKEPAIVFTEYRDTLDRLAAALADEPHAQLHGGLPAADRRDAERRFSSGRVRLLLATDAASEGLNLHHQCRLVINLELPWTPLRLEQRVGRVDRIGQSRRVHAVHFIARGTAEEQVVERLVRREWHARASLDAIARVDPDTIARLVIEQAAPPPFGPPPDTAGFTPDLRSDAVAECGRLTHMRAVTSDRHADTMRPIVTCVRRVRPPSLVCAWTIPVLAADELWLWHTLIGSLGSIDERRVASPADVRAVLDRHHDAATAAIGDAAVATIASFLRLTRVPVARAATRERAIAGRIGADRAAMAAALLQRGLFEHRDERRLARQSAQFDAALGRCRARIEMLSNAEAARGDRPRVAFAVVFGR